jgi:hypothetical protein
MARNFRQRYQPTNKPEGIKCSKSYRGTPDGLKKELPTADKLHKKRDRRPRAIFGLRPALSGQGTQQPYKSFQTYEKPHQ